MTAPAPLSPPARFTDLLAAEWIKIRSLRSTPWLLGLITLFVIAAATLESLNDRGELDPDTAPSMALMDAFSRMGFMTLMLAAGSVGAIAVVSEYSSGLIRTTTVAVPARGAVLLAKAVVVGALWTVVGVVTASGSFLVMRLVLGPEDRAAALSDPGAFRAFAASALVAPVCALIGLGLGALIRHSATTMVTVAFTLLMLPSFFSIDRRWTAEAHHAMVMSAWERLVDTWPFREDIPGIYETDIGTSWAVFAVWPLLAVAAGLLVIRRRDV